MSPQTTRRHPLSFWRSTAELGVDEFNSLLELLKVPAILFDTSLGKITATNSHALTFSAYTRTEIGKLRLNQLFPRLPVAGLFQSENNDFEYFDIELVTRSGQAVPSVLKFHSLDIERNWLLLTFEALNVIRKREDQDEKQAKHIYALRELAHTLSSRDSTEIIERVLEIGKILTGAAHLAVYSVSQENPKLILNNDVDPLLELPEEMPAAEISKLAKPYLWMPGRRIRSVIHRLARANNYAYIASAPIGEEPAILGLLVATEQDGIPSDNLVEILEILSTYLLNAFQRSALLSNLSKDRERQMEKLLTFESILENAHDGIIVLSPEFNILEMNPSAELTLGYASKEVFAQPIENVIIGAGNLTAALDAAASGISTPNLGNISIHRRDGHAFPASLQITPVFKDGSLLKILLLMSDLSEHQQIKLRTQQLEQRALLGEVTAIFAHEVRNPINNISMGLQLFEINLDQEDANREIVERMKQDCDRLTHLMDSVLSFSRTSDYIMEPLDIRILLERLLMRWKPRMAKVNVESKLIAPEHLPQINGNEKALEQVFNNLFSNSLRAMTESGGNLNIRVSVVKMESGNKGLQIDVSDTGPGIPPDIVNNIFDPFFTTDPQGTGLGLAITQRIILSHKGRIQVQSFPGGGTVFEIRIPVGTNGQME